VAVIDKKQTHKKKQTDKKKKKKEKHTKEKKKSPKKNTKKNKKKKTKNLPLISCSLSYSGPKEADFLAQRLCAIQAWKGGGI